ncbi:MAG: IS66 family transposase [Syntrophobacteraceae bacterium]
MKLEWRRSKRIEFNLNRQEKMFLRYGIELSRSTMAEWIVKAAGWCNPLMDLLYKELLVGPLINVDETPILVLNEPERANTTKSYMWVFRGGYHDKPLLLFEYSETRSGALPRDVLAGYRGYCQTDGFSGYDALEASNPNIRLVGCFFHARRNFVKVIDARGKVAKKKPGSAEVALDYIGRLYKVEKIARERKLSAWDKLIRYTENGYITPDDTMVENDIRPYAVGSRNWLFAGHPNGAHASATLYSLIVTARACGLDPYQYLRLLFSKIPHTRTEDDFRALMSQNLTSEMLSCFLSSLSFL